MQKMALCVKNHFRHAIVLLGLISGVWAWYMNIREFGPQYDWLASSAGWGAALVGSGVLLSLWDGRKKS